jgi:hypothetical protein
VRRKVGQGVVRSRAGTREALGKRRGAVTRENARGVGVAGFARNRARARGSTRRRAHQVDGGHRTVEHVRVRHCQRRRGGAPRVLVVVQEAGDVLRAAERREKRRTGEGDVSCRRRRGDAARGAEASARGGARGRPSPRKQARRSAPPARREDARGRARAGAGREGSAERGVGGGVCESGGAIERRGSGVRRTHLHCGDDDSWSPPWAAPSCFRAPNIVAKRFRGRVLPPAPVSGLHRPGEWTRALERVRTLSGRKPRGRAPRSSLA